MRGTPGGSLIHGSTAVAVAAGLAAVEVGLAALLLQKQAWRGCGGFGSGLRQCGRECREGRGKDDKAIHDRKNLRLDSEPEFIRPAGAWCGFSAA